VGELAQDSETRDPQDRLAVNPAGAGRKNERLSREICLPARGLATVAATRWDGAAEVSSGHSTSPGGGRAKHTDTRHHGKARRRNEAESQATGFRLGGGG
jgi:hypothetical protein